MGNVKDQSETIESFYYKSYADELIIGSSKLRVLEADCI
jgi:hypothetical protein